MRGEIHISQCKKRNMPRVFFPPYNCFQHAAATVISKSTSASTAKKKKLLLSSVIKYLKTLLNYTQKNKRKQTRANNSCMIDWDYNN